MIHKKNNNIVKVSNCVDIKQKFGILINEFINIRKDEKLFWWMLSTSTEKIVKF